MELVHPSAHCAQLAISVSIHLAKQNKPLGYFLSIMATKTDNFGEERASCLSAPPSLDGLWSVVLPRMNPCTNKFWIKVHVDVQICEWISEGPLTVPTFCNQQQQQQHLNDITQKKRHHCLEFELVGWHSPSSEVLDDKQGPSIWATCQLFFTGPICGTRHKQP